MKKRVVIILALCVAMSLIFAAACGKKKGAEVSAAKEPAPTKTVIAKIGSNDVVTWEELENTYHLSRMRARYNEEQIQRLIDNLVRQHVVYLDGVANGYDKDPEYVEQIERMKRQLISRIALKKLADTKTEVTEQDMKAYYDANPDNFNVMKIEYLMFSQAKYDNDKEKARADAQKALKAIRGGMTFEDAAKKFILRDRPFNMAMRKGQDSFFGKTFDDTLWTMQKDAITDLIETPQGFIIAKVMDRNAQTFDMAKSYIRTTLNRESSTKKVDVYYESLMKKYNVKIDDVVIKQRLSEFGNAPQESVPGGGPGGGPGMMMRPPAPAPGGANQGAIPPQHPPIPVTPPSAGQPGQPVTPPR